MGYCGFSFKQHNEAQMPCPSLLRRWLRHFCCIIENDIVCIPFWGANYRSKHLKVCKKENFPNDLPPLHITPSTFAVWRVLSLFEIFKLQQNFSVYVCLSEAKSKWPMPEPAASWHFGSREVSQCQVLASVSVCLSLVLVWSHPAPYSGVWK